jgi:hypothetical protein
LQRNWRARRAPARSGRLSARAACRPPRTASPRTAS